jgi:hypothetical protein
MVQITDKHEIFTQGLYRINEMESRLKDKSIWFGDVERQVFKPHIHKPFNHQAK